MKIAVDAMGGDYAPSVVIEGASLALNEFPDVNIVLVGHAGRCGLYLEKFGCVNHPRLTMVHTDEVVEMGDSSTSALRSKKKSSISIAADLVKQGEADAVVSAGHTGATVAATKVKVRMLPGVDRPAIGAIMPATGGRFIVIDAGANTDCAPRNLAQFALMGEAYSKLMFDLKEPRVGLLSVGGEDVKGNELTKETFKILSKMSINFAGNVEGNDIFKLAADVVVCDGFVGNVLLKASESLAEATMYWLKDVFTKNAFRMTGAILGRNAFRELKAIGDSEEYGGAPLLGLNSPCVIGHGASTPKAIKNAIKVTNEFVKFGINDQITRKIAECGVAFSKSKDANER